MTVFLADIASFQHGLNLAGLRPGCVGVEIKSTEGSTYVNPDYAAWLPQAKAAGLLTVAYHYVTGDSPAAQADWLAEHIIDKTVPVMLDVEQAGVGLPQALEVADAMAADDLNVRLMYLPRSVWQRTGSPAMAAPLASRHLSLIQASYPTSAAGSPAGLYPGDSSPLWAAYGGVTPTMLQFTDAALLGGQRVDCNAFRGSASQLAALLSTPAAPVPAGSAPKWPGRTLRYSGPKTAQMHGNDVRTWQTRMALRGWKITADGWYGPASAVVCKAFQSEFHAHGLAVDGLVGPATWAAAWTVPVTD